MTENENSEVVSFKSIKADIIAKVNKKGAMGEMESWRKAYPDLPFEEYDDRLTGEEVFWENRTIEERAFYVAYINDPEATGVSYRMVIDRTVLNKTINDSEIIWNMWLDGCFCGEEDMDEEGIKTLLWFIDDRESTRSLIEDMDLEDVALLGLDVVVAPL